MLHKSLPGRRANLKLQRFSCVESISSSDHKPVFAEYLVRTTLPIVVDPSLSATESTLVEVTDLAAKDLLGMDMTGLSDPYVRLWVFDNVLSAYCVLGPSTDALALARAPF